MENQENRGNKENQEDQNTHIFSRYPECRKQFQNMTLNMLCDFEDEILRAKEYLGVLGCESKMTREEMLELIGETIKEKTATEHDRVKDLYKKSLKEILTAEEHRWIFLHKNRCERCKQETRLGRLTARVGLLGGSTPKSIKIRDITSNQQKLLSSKIAGIKKKLSSITVRETTKKRIAIAASVTLSVIVVVLTGSVLIRSYIDKKIENAKTTYQEKAARKKFQVKKRRANQEIMKFADQYEEASKKLKENPSDLNALVSRAEAAEELNLPAKALEDYESYLKLAIDASSRAMAEGKVTKLQEAINNPTKPEATYYEELNSCLNSYLLSLIEGKNAEAQNQLEIAKAVATLMMKDSNDKVGIDLVEFYSRLSVDTAKELLEARLETEEVSKVVAIDHFQDSIDKLYKVKDVFVRHSAVIDAQTVAVLLAKFLSKAGRVAEARTEVDQWLTLSKDRAYLFNYAQFLFWDGNLNVHERKEQEALRKLQESIEICQKLDTEKFILYPLLVTSQLCITADLNEKALNMGVEGLLGSTRYNVPAFTSQFLQTAGRAATGINKPYLAEEYLEEAIKLCEKEELWGYGAIAKATLAAILAQQEDTKKALELIETAKAIDLSKNVDPKARKQFLMQVISYEGKVQGLSKNFVKSEAAYRNFIAMSQEFGYLEPIGIGQIKKGLGEALLEQGKRLEAAKEFNAAKEEFEKVNEGLHPKNNNKFLDYSFSGKDIDELIKLVQP